MFLKKEAALLLFIFLAFRATAQKPVIDTGAIDRWPNTIFAVISSNGRYVGYQVSSLQPNKNQLVISDMISGWNKKYNDGFDLHFSRNNEKACIRKAGAIYILTLGKEDPDTIIQTGSAKQPVVDTGEWLAYRPIDNGKQLILRNWDRGEEKKFESVDEYKWENHGDALVISLRNDNETILKWVDVKTGAIKSIWSSPDSLAAATAMAYLHFSPKGDQLAFLVKGHQTSNTEVWLYSKGFDQARKLADNNSKGIPAGMSITGFSFNNENKTSWLQLTLEKPFMHDNKMTPDLAMVDVYSYKDAVLQSQQLANLQKVIQLDAFVSIASGKVVTLQRSMDKTINVLAQNKDYIVLSERSDEKFEPWWLLHSESGYLKPGSDYFLQSLSDGRKKLIKKASSYPVDDFSFSGDGMQLIYWDSEQAGYLGFNVQTGRTVNLTHKVPNVKRSQDYIDMFGNSMYAQPIDYIKWVDSGKYFLIYSTYDVWKIDPTGRQNPVNLTYGYGAKRHILLRLFEDHDVNAHRFIDQDDAIAEKENAVIVGLNEQNKQNGFFKISLTHPGLPQLLTQGPYNFYRVGSQIPGTFLSFSEGLRPVKAKNADAWVLSRETANSYPNLYYTRDWKTFTPLTDLQPQKAYNWLTSELINYKQLDGTVSQGVLYKPEDFDPKKKYPVIFYYYEHLSYRLYEFPKPEYASGPMDISWFVSRGYLVFTPDMHYSIASKKGGRTVGEAALNSVAGAVKFLSKLPYVDIKHLGVQGHSFGGGETNYLTTHSNLFAAACSAAGTVSDQVSAYLGPYRPKGEEPSSYRMAHSENGHDMIGATLWERPDLYFRSSSVFNANRVTTPLLLMHNEKDDQTDWGQSFELYNALRRLGKKVWLLQYDYGEHALLKKVDAEDFTIRLNQFFDHFLKGAPAPKWMVEGIPASMKGIDQGYELMPGQTP